MSSPSPPVTPLTWTATKNLLYRPTENDAKSFLEQLTESEAHEGANHFRAVADLFKQAANAKTNTKKQAFFND
jgi:hypothetical protein